MKVLNDFEDFLKRFNHFKNGEFRSIEIVSPTKIVLTFAGQDESRQFDWISLKLEFSGIQDAKLLENKKLPLLDMSEGISIVKDSTFLAFGFGECYNISNVRTASIYMICSCIKYEEEKF